MLPHESGEAGERSETEGGAMQSIALILRRNTQSNRFAPPSVSKLTAPPIGKTFGGASLFSTDSVNCRPTEALATSHFSFLYSFKSGQFACSAQPPNGHF